MRRLKLRKLTFLTRFFLPLDCLDLSLNRLGDLILIAALMGLRLQCCLGQIVEQVVALRHTGQGFGHVRDVRLRIGARFGGDQ